MFCCADFLPKGFSKKWTVLKRFFPEGSLQYLLTMKKDFDEITHIPTNFYPDEDFLILLQTTVFFKWMNNAQEILSWRRSAVLTYNEQELRRNNPSLLVFILVKIFSPCFTRKYSPKKMNNPQEFSSWYSFIVFATNERILQRKWTILKRPYPEGGL